LTKIEPLTKRKKRISIPDQKASDEAAITLSTRCILRAGPLRTGKRDLIFIPELYR
jgi:hypothetical protein